MKKFFLGFIFSLTCGLSVACSGGGSATDQTVGTTYTVPMHPDTLESELKGALIRTGLKTENVVFKAASDRVTFNLGTCEGEIVRSVADKPGHTLTITEKKSQANVLTLKVPAGEKAILSADQQKTVTEKCGHL